MFALQRKAARTAKRAGLFAAGTVLCLVGVGFLTLAGWFFLSVTMTPLQAALILTAVYFGIGLLLIGLSQRKSQSRVYSAQKAAEEPPTASDVPPLMQAFLYGLQAGSKAKKPKT